MLNTARRQHSGRCYVRHSGTAVSLAAVAALSVLTLTQGLGCDTSSISGKLLNPQATGGDAAAETAAAFTTTSSGIETDPAAELQSTADLAAQPGMSDLDQLALQLSEPDVLLVPAEPPAVTNADDSGNTGSQPAGDDGDDGDDDDDGPPSPPCIDEFRQAARRCVEQIRSIVHDCLDNARPALTTETATGNGDAARPCIEQINQVTDACLESLRDLCVKCVERLMEAEAPVEVIEAVIRACERAADFILEARRAAICSLDEAADRRFAAECVEKMRMLATRCAESNGMAGKECAAEVARLVEAGELVQAAATARDCIRKIRRGSGECAGQIGEVCRRCLHRLVRGCNGNPELTRHVHQACERAIRLVFDSARGAIHEIRSQLPPPPDEGGDDSGAGNDGNDDGASAARK